MTYTLIRSDTGGYTDLEPLAEALGLSIRKPTAFTVQRGPYELSFGLDINSGTVVGLKITARWPRGELRGPFLTVRAETAQDLTDKASRLSREVQLGLPRFDDAVFIDSDARDDEVRRLLSTEGVRETLRRLLRNGVAAIAFHPSHLEATLKKPSGGFGLNAMTDAANGFYTLLEVGPPRGAPVERRGAALAAVSPIAVLFSAVGFSLCASAFPIGTASAITAAVIPGLLSLGLVFPLARRISAGDSGSGPRARSLTVQGAMWCGFLGACVFLAVNASAGSQQPHDFPGVVRSVGSYDDEDHTWSVTIEWSDGSTASYHLKEPQPAVGRAARLHWVDGLFVQWGRRVWLE